VNAPMDRTQPHSTINRHTHTPQHLASADLISINFYWNVRNRIFNMYWPIRFVYTRDVCAISF
jgi:hypothetical protein